MNRYVVTEYGAVADLDELQTSVLQAVLDLCKENGGTVVIPRGRFLTGSLRLWSNMTLILETGAILQGSDVCEDYEIYTVPEGVSLRTDKEMIPQYLKEDMCPGYRRAILSVYGGENIAIIGEPGSIIEGADCADPFGEEGYRGPHGIFITNVEHITLRGYTIQNCGNFMHQIDNCQDIVMQEVACFGGSDGIHLHCCDDIAIEDCVFHTGDDCIAGINMSNIVVRRCDLNTSCDVFRAGAVHMLVEDCHIWGPGVYPHRVTVIQGHGTDMVRNRDNALKREEGRHNLIFVYIHFASMSYPATEPFHDIVFRNCRIENADAFLHYDAKGFLERGTHLMDMTLDNVEINGLKESCDVCASEDEPLTVYLKNVKTSFKSGNSGNRLFDGKDENTRVIEDIR